MGKVMLHFFVREQVMDEAAEELGMGPREEILRIEVVNDCGRAVNPMIVEGQIEGGMVQGMGYVLWENPAVEADTGRHPSNQKSSPEASYGNSHQV
jgi:hypothetical protein